ncbi:aldo/keto reductase [Salisediminibacterium halotolerans]|uniref:aldo/keto reductase n=1 Tax=Salisediminibacterium halotolerans TaxID=517425 RepID=UPI000EAD0646|nr:aldo/keto reductase [Salisediminibacterium halotolerans]RLJ75498.1 aryl-alcohol dehydrogenase-like predicted oxidoreductase [Actinophytocola xinjiangensis]RPE89351.1 aryl-alcohol dehydrogenase-like predicted oxidoreductase [Salisediminibacterium halotolerans]TWG36111.1 aryl-alcohol dehydrogenase-like predicted oxidoreductase [Salisediminibacterium halotolerans]GEL08035.1 oxidoreductase [Salisediminibacterium halotolerans]
MKKRPLGNTGKFVSEIGLGAWQLGNTKNGGTMTEREGIEIVEQALESGCNFFDTAPNYALGKSERILGKALDGKRDEVIISSKFGHHANGEIDFDPATIAPSVDDSLGRLKTNYLDCVLLHNPPFEYLNGETEHFAELEKLKQAGKIDAYGVSVDTSEEMFAAMNQTNSQVIEVMFNIFHQDPANAFQAAYEKGIGLIVKVPLDSGWLSGKYNAESTFADIRSRWTPEIIKMRTNMLEETKKYLNQNESLVKQAMAFILAYEQVSTVIPGAKSVAQLEENFSAAGSSMDSETVKQLQQMWENELKDNSLPW